ncbi:fructose-1,6-bisphosphate aldolase [Ordospora colligata]|uniref:fructose-bisphosphate aldolase n=1 Tax=Ordospora colligata OC4 TaxID=1354746 RepID=A0A0B2UM71_9MICR|nr:fructose-1,6-bisphosphate aldolase [Ordospora colligata OC4]KHN70359.1 fructose-1,6-bisphosphate aldolase [Ordospora colligata OC4]TBU17109.1 fructose-1,6-bisphosphate aldolase [Ordospora colligata]TBU17359.1 fructose-1,6-bisphosphate aldolase [Ordospora colligata]TBU19539.1 fructose-1,6-bisphosphate aldolase [Ordospora colligata]
MDCNHLLKLGMNAKKLLENGKGILAADETPCTLGKRFSNLGIENTAENRRRFRELLFGAEQIDKYISGVIFHEEALGQTDNNGSMLTGVLLKKNIAIGIKLDKGLIDYKEREKISVGLEDLDLRCKSPEFKDVTFAKWRSLFYFDNEIPSQDCINDNCEVLAKYAITCQKNGLVPIVEPEIFFEGDYTIERAFEMSRRILSTLVMYLNYESVYMPGLLIKPSFVTAGSINSSECTPRKVASLTFKALLSTIPCAVPGIVFLSGGQGTENAMKYLNALNLERGCRTWALSFSFARALTQNVLEAWAGIDENVPEAQRILLENVLMASKASNGELKVLDAECIDE